MRIRPDAKRLTWHPAFQYPFESGWSILQKVKVLNNLCDDEVRELIATEKPPLRKYSLGNCADSSWIDFARFSELLEVPEYELRNGYWDQLGIQVERSMGYDRGYCIECWNARCYHCVFFDLTWLKKCPWHGSPIEIFKRQPLRLGARPSAWGDPSEVPFDDLLMLGPMPERDRHRIMGYVLEYLEWWRAVQVQVPTADYLLRELVSTYHRRGRDDNVVQWQAGFAKSRASTVGFMGSGRCQCHAVSVYPLDGCRPPASIYRRPEYRARRQRALLSLDPATYISPIRAEAPGLFGKANSPGP